MYEKAVLSEAEVRKMVFDMVDDTMKRGDSGISICFTTEGGMYINVYPMRYDDEAEEEKAV